MITPTCHISHVTCHFSSQYSIRYTPTGMNNYKFKFKSNEEVAFFHHITKFPDLSKLLTLVVHNDACIVRTFIQSHILNRPILAGAVLNTVLLLREDIGGKNLLLLEKSSKGSCPNPNFSRNFLLLFVFGKFLMQRGGGSHKSKLFEELFCLSSDFL